MQSIWAAKIFGDKEDPRVRLSQLFGGAVPKSGQPPEPAVVWGREVVLRAPSSSPRDVTGITRELRRADSRLTLAAATFLAEHLVKAQ